MEKYIPFYRSKHSDHKKSHKRKFIDKIFHITRVVRVSYWAMPVDYAIQVCIVGQTTSASRQTGLHLQTNWSGKRVENNTII